VITAIAITTITLLTTARATRPPERSLGRGRIRYRYIAHNGEISTVQGNRNWMRARGCLELLHPGGRPLTHALLMIPEPWENHAEIGMRAGPATDAVIDKFASLLESDGMLINGGNAHSRWSTTALSTPTCSSSPRPTTCYGRLLPRT
jgi:hypothetical protein